MVTTLESGLGGAKPAEHGKPNYTLEPQWETTADAIRYHGREALRLKLRLRRKLAYNVGDAHGVN